MRADVLKKLAARVPFPVPGSLVDREVDRRVEEFAHRLMDQRIDPRKANIDWAAFREAQREPASESVASALVLDEIVQREDVAVSEAELDAELEKYSARAGFDRPGGAGAARAGRRTGSAGRGAAAREGAVAGAWTARASWSCEILSRRAVSPWAALVDNAV